MTPIPMKDIQMFDDAIYYPLLISVLQQDQEHFKNGPFKLKSPYINLIDKVLTKVHNDFRENRIYLQRNKMEVARGENNGTFTEYIFVYNGIEDRRRYLNARLRNRTEELLNEYLQ